MRIMIDTNVLISALLFPNSRISKMMAFVSARHTLTIASYVVDELRAVVERKFPKKAEDVDALLACMSYEYLYTPQEMDATLFAIRDEMDYPVLYTAMVNGVDVLITGDKDFASVEIDSPEILTPAHFMEKYM